MTTRSYRWLLEAYGADQAPNPVHAERLELIARNRYTYVTAVPRQQVGQQRPLNTYLQAMQSLRDVVEPAEIVVGPAQASLLRRLTNA